ncbi:hypothetical protein BI347_20575 [Chromobacterium sphagni]|uniref:Uncharacterized protein n=2 Tax=Chromobacterium sphagni TaxID=1903179 RepID=A0A1S1WSY5_9NEIS|nr:hypothetical protein BI347_20575 [Chromobacterium sphagni]OHX19100.1 hypothetical protein BI344_19350 [Chromobacterium sphagni]
MATVSESHAAVSESYTWTLTAFQQQGTLWLQWHSTAPFRAQQGQIHVYAGTQFPSNPQDQTKAWKWDDASNDPWNTDLPWGSKWFCAWIAQEPPNGPYKYVVQVVTPVAQ